MGSWAAGSRPRRIEGDGEHSVVSPSVLEEAIPAAGLGPRFWMMSVTVFPAR
jgi:hypothetical protein